MKPSTNYNGKGSSVNYINSDSSLWLRYILSGLVAIFFALLGIQMRAQENIDSVQDEKIHELSGQVKEQERSIMRLQLSIENLHK